MDEYIDSERLAAAERAMQAAVERRARGPSDPDNRRAFAKVIGHSLSFIRDIDDIERRGRAENHYMRYTG